MRLGIVLRGITARDQAGIPSIGGKPNMRDWNLCKDNIKEKLIDPMKSLHDVTTYLTTYKGSPVEDLEKFYDPTSVFLLDYEGSHQRITMIKSIYQIRDEPIDFVISTRFDLEFFKSVSEYNFDFNKFNFLYKEIEPNWTNSKFVSDCFFAFPIKYAESFIEAITNEFKHPSRVGYTDMHNAYVRMKEVIGEENLHFIHDAPHPVREGENEYIKIIRI